MRHTAFVLALLLLTACSMAQASRDDSALIKSSRAHFTEPQAGLPDSVVQFLITSAATDFHKTLQSHPLRFREVRIGHVKAPDGKHQYLMCGEFLQADASDHENWIPFVTIKTSGYEQYTGAQALRFCSDTSVVWQQLDDLSSLLQSQFESLR